MQGILLVSHGPMAEAVVASASWFFGGRMQRVSYLGLSPEQSPDQFSEMIGQQISELDEGDGVIVLADLFGGTPIRQTTSWITEKVTVVGGMNLPMLLAVLEGREDGLITAEELIQMGQLGIKRWQPAAQLPCNDLFD